MTIQVISNTSEPVEAAKPEPVEGAKSASAPESKDSEQNESPESDTEEKDDKESTDDSEDKDSDEEIEAKDSEDKKPVKKGGFQRKIDKLTARVSDHAREAEFWKAQALKTAGEPKTEKVESKPAAQEGKPNPENFETHAEYVEALTDWKTDQKLMERDQKIEKSKLQIEHENTLKAHSERVKVFTEKHEDFAEALAEVDDVIISPTFQEMIISSENGPALMYELAKNRAEFERINALTPLAAAREIGKIESKLSLDASPEKKTEPKKLTTAPKPLDPVGKGSSGRGAKSLNDPNLSQAEYERIRREQQRRKEA